MIKKYCLTCNCEFMIKPYRDKVAKWCSNKCRSTYSNQKASCFVCKKEFIRKTWEFNKAKNHVYCSRKCFEARSPLVEVKCSGCQKVFKIYQSRASYYIKYYCDNVCRLKHGCIGRLTD